MVFTTQSLSLSGTMATTTTARGLQISQLDSDSETTSTLREPRSSMTSPDLSRSNSTSPHNLTCNDELATLNNKLIRAINHQTDLDDTLSDTCHELEATRRRVKDLEAVVKDHHALVSNGGLVPKDEVERQKVQLMSNLAHEQRQRGVMEKDKRGMEQELESLTTALFEEANQVPPLAFRFLPILIATRWFQLLGRSVKPLIDVAINCETSLTTQNFF